MPLPACANGAPLMLMERVHISPTATQRAAEVFAGIPLGAIMTTTLEEVAQ